MPGSDLPMVAPSKGPGAFRLPGSSKATPVIRPSNEESGPVGGASRVVVRSIASPGCLKGTAPRIARGTLTAWPFAFEVRGARCSSPYLGRL